MKCQEYTFTPYIESRDDFSTRPPEKVQRRSPSESKRSESEEGKSQSDGSVWFCSGNLPVVQTDTYIMQDDIGKYLQCGMHSRQACSLCSRTEYK